MPNFKEYNFRTQRFSDLPLNWNDHRDAQNYLKRIINPNSRFFDFIDSPLSYNVLEGKLWQKSGLIGLRLLTLAITSENSIFQQNSEYFYPGTTITAPVYTKTFQVEGGNELQITASNEHAMLVKLIRGEQEDTARTIYRICLPVGTKVRESNPRLTLYARFIPPGRKYGLNYYPLHQKTFTSIENFIDTVILGIGEFVATIPEDRQRPISGIGNYF